MKKKRESATTRAKKSASAKRRWSDPDERDRQAARSKASIRVRLKPKRVAGLLPAQAARLGKLYSKEGGELLNFQPHPAAKSWGRENAWLLTATAPDVVVADNFLRCLDRAGMRNVAFYVDPAQRGFSVHCIAVCKEPL